MSFFKFLFSKTFLKQILLAGVVFAVLIFVILFWLKETTNHDQRIAVPDLSKMSLGLVQQELNSANLNYIVIDSSNYNPDYPAYSVIEQTPAAGKFVKENRKIYLVLNPSGYMKLEIPEVVGTTRRQAEPRLVALGFRIGKIDYRDHIAKDEVLEIRHKGSRITAGERLPKMSVIDLVLGNGEIETYRPETTEEYSETETDEDAGF